MDGWFALSVFLSLLVLSQILWPCFWERRTRSSSWSMRVYRIWFLLFMVLSFMLQPIASGDKKGDKTQPWRLFFFQVYIVFKKVIMWHCTILSCSLHVSSTCVTRRSKVYWSNLVRSLSRLVLMFLITSMVHLLTVLSNLFCLSSASPYICLKMLWMHL